MMVMATEGVLQALPAPLDSTHRGPGGARCLIVSGDGIFRSRAEAAADLSGCVACAMPADFEALSRALDEEFEIVLVDMARPLGDRVSDSVEIAEEFSVRGSHLYVFCGSDDGVEEELWARQLGAWVFKPGEWPRILAGAF